MTYEQKMLIDLANKDQSLMKLMLAAIEEFDAYAISSNNVKMEETRLKAETLLNDLLDNKLEIQKLSHSIMNDAIRKYRND